jgi:hypothetical protein
MAAARESATAVSALDLNIDVAQAEQMQMMISLFNSVAALNCAHALLRRLRIASPSLGVTLETGAISLCSAQLLPDQDKVQE